MEPLIVFRCCPHPVLKISSPPQGGGYGVPEHQRDEREVPTHMIFHGKKKSSDSFRLKHPRRHSQTKSQRRTQYLAMILQASYRLARFFAPVVSLMCLALCCEGLLGFVLLISRVWKMHPLALGAGSGRARKARFLRFSQPSFGFVKSSGFSHWDGDFSSQKWATSKWYPFESFGKCTVHLSILADIILLPPFQKTLHSLCFWFLKWHWFLRKKWPLR